MGDSLSTQQMDQWGSDTDFAHKLLLSYCTSAQENNGHLGRKNIRLIGHAIWLYRHI